MGASHASKGGRRWRYYVSRAALTGRTQEAGSVVRIPASEIENRVARAVGPHLAGGASAIDGCHINHGVRGGDQAIPQLEPTRRLRGDPPTEKDVRNAIERATVGATRIEIVLSESVVAEGQDRVLTLPRTWTLRAVAARSSRAWAKRSNPCEQCERRREMVSLPRLRALGVAVLAEAAMEGRLPRGFCVKRLTDLPMLWSEQWRALGLQAPIQLQAEPS